MADLFQLSTFLSIFVAVSISMVYQPISPIRTYQRRLLQAEMPSGSLPTSSPTNSTPTLDAASPALSSQFSQADTLLTHDSHYTANTGGRARQSWRGRNLSRLNPFLSNDLENKPSQRGSSGVEVRPFDPAIVPQLLQPPPSELPAAPVPRPDEPRSFFDSGSDSDSDGQIPDRDTVINRASSVHVQRPRIVEHHSNHHISNSPLIQGQHLVPSTNPGPSLSKAQRLLGHQIKSLYDLTPATEEPPAKSSHRSVTNLDEKASISALPPTSHSGNSTIRESMIKYPDTPTRAEALDTLPTPMGGFDSLSITDPYSSGATDGLRSNPTDKDAAKLHRAISAPPLATRGLANRKVTIRPSDLVITDAAGHHRLFRESVVSTPYPTRHSSIQTQEERAASAMSLQVHNPILSVTKEEDEKTDRFPSPFRGETLFLRLYLARHAEANAMVEIPVLDKRTFDDAELFSTIRKQTKTGLLGRTRRLFTARTLRHATLTSTDATFDEADFIAHLRAPKMGRKRKTWLLWLRAHQGSSASPTSSRTPYVSPATVPRMPFSAKAAPPSSLPPQITLHHGFSLPRVAAVMCCTLLASVLATVLWILFGVPGLPAEGRARAIVGGDGLAQDWRLDAQARVLTGLVLGVFVFLLGSMVNAAWVAGSWVLL